VARLAFLLTLVFLSFAGQARATDLAAADFPFRTPDGDPNYLYACGKIRLGRSTPLGVAAAAVPADVARDADAPTPTRMLEFLEEPTFGDSASKNWLAAAAPPTDILGTAVFDPVAFAPAGKPPAHSPSNYSTTPEPASIYVAGLGFGGMWFVRKRLRRKPAAGATGPRRAA
jgi:hypothetical protein